MVQHGFLHNHTMYSLHDSAMTPEELVLRAKELGAENVTLTDHGTLLGVEPFMEAGAKHGINTIPGVEAYTEHRAHLVIVAVNYDGYLAISKAMRDANECIEIPKFNTTMSFPIMTDAILEKHFKGNRNVFATSACIGGPAGQILLREKWKEELRAKEDRELKELESASERYLSDGKEAAAMADEVKKLKEEKKTLASATGKSALKKLEKLKKEEMDGQVSFFANANPYEEAKRRFDQMKAALENVEQRIRDTMSAMAAAKKEASSLKKQREKYLSLKKEIESREIESEDDLREQAVERIRFLKGIFPRFYIEMQNHGSPMEEYAMKILAGIAEEEGIPLIAANDAHMAKREDIEARQVMRYGYFNRHQGMSDMDRELYLKTDEELGSAIGQVIGPDKAKEAVDALSILDECHVIFPDGKHYPSIEKSVSFDALLEKKKKEMIAMGEWDEEHESRLAHETAVIKKMGYVDYHLVVWDFCNEIRELGTIPKEAYADMPTDFHEIGAWIKENKYRSGLCVSPGRGSAVGSLVCYMLGITNVDPLKYGLLFERFLNPERVSMPDIDTDVKKSMRPVMIRYLKWKYGERAVASIATESTYAGKKAVQDAGRDRASELFSGISVKKDRDEAKRAYMSRVFKMSDLLSNDATISDSEELREFASKDKELQIVLERAKLIEGKVWGTGIHAGGVVISDNDDISDYMPLAWNEENHVWALQGNMFRVENRGLLKMDLLGLNTLDCISDALRMIEERTGKLIDISRVPFEKEVFDNIYSSGRTNSVFQFESDGMKQILRRFRPSCIEDVILLNAAYRPGPMQYIDDIIERKHGRKATVYEIPELKPILNETYGACIYQEQVMQIFQSLAGYTLGQSDLVRRAMSKKKEEKLKVERAAFVHGDPERNIPGCEARGIDPEAADRLFDEMMDFARYAFNKSHATAYTMVSYYTAWLKYHYPTEFLCSMFNNKEQAKYEPIIEDCFLYDIDLLPPDINRSKYSFCVEGENGIRFGFSGIAGIGTSTEKTLNRIIRGRSGEDFEEPYVSMKDFLARNLSEEMKLPDRGFVHTLVFGGAFDRICPDREYMAWAYDEIAKTGGSTVEILKEHIGEFQEDDSRMPDRAFNNAKEIELLGSMISSNPLKAYADDSAYGCQPLSELKDGEVKVFGMITSIEDRRSKAGNPMLLIHLQGKSGKVTAIAMRDAYEQMIPRMNDYLQRVVLIDGEAKDSTVFIRRLRIHSPNVKKYGCYIDSEEKKTLFESIVKGHEGDREVIVKYARTEERPLPLELYYVDASALKNLAAEKMLI